MTQQSQNQVRKRRVFYIPGYDPYPPRRYRELYRTESAEQGDLSGYEISVRQRRTPGQYGWHVTADIYGATSEAEVDVLVWSDLVKASMGLGIFATYLTLVKTAWIYISTGALRRLMRLRKGPVIAALYPVMFLLLQVLIAVVLATVVGRIVSSLTFAGAGWIVGLPLILLILRWFAARDKRYYAYYLMQDYGFSAAYRGQLPPVLEPRLAEFERQISEALQSDVDEVLVVGHSSGVHLGVHVLANIVRNTTVHQDGPALAFLSLGQVVPMVSFLPKADQLRADLHLLAKTDRLTWVDVSAPGDGCSFALCDPVAVSGVAPASKRWPLVVSAAFSQTLSPEKWAALKRRYFRLHFQYLCAFDRPGDYDYFQITAGPKTLAERYEGRAPSKSRIDVAASGYRTMRK